MMSSLSFLRVWEMPNKYTFRMKSVGELLKGEMVGVWADPFSGLHSPASIRNDADEANPAEHHMDGLDFLKTLADSSVDGVLFDPPYFRGTGVTQVQAEAERNGWTSRVLGTV